ncbi:vWA domain-containing protein [Haloferula rosea]|uniref:von Willebrand factor type A domain-containing protein n=1 Tax=Haloferula rosea TaxID=490093 RepID=A0A934R9R9_9BACT|nr:von Willebrand factor type A domain-containing protein [Haloferula rosea]MBK1826628.1 von Willebrand factor type A domain-containing protein [Haloferula rosea]
MKAEDDLMDALLKEQARNRDADEQLLEGIEKAIDEDAPKARRRIPAWVPLSAAAAVAMGGAWVHYKNRAAAPEVAYHHVTEQEDRTRALPGPRGKLPAESAAVESRELDTFAVEPESGMAALDRLEKADTFVAEEHTPGMDVPADSGAISPPAPPAVVKPMPARAPQGGSVPADGLANEAPFAKTDTTGKAGNIQSRSLSTGRSMPQPRMVPVPEPRPPLGEGILDRGGNTERYGQLVDQPWKSALDTPLSTFSIDVDTASFTNLRRAIREGRRVQPDAVRIEECINYFDYRYPAPEGERPFAVDTAITTCPWAPEHLLARVALKGREVEMNARPASNLVFLIDVSGSMQSPDKLQLLKRSMKMLVKSLDERDRVGIVVYAGTEGVVLPPTLLDEDGKRQALSAIGKLESGGSTNGGAGLQRAYQMALNHKRDGGVNRVILATDGDFNVGVTGQGELVKLVQKRAAKGVYLTVLGFGTGNLNDALMEQISNDGNGNYFYLDGRGEAKRVLMNKLSGTLVTIAKDVKIQVEFNPGKVAAYRLIGYANRVLRDRDFNDDKVDAGEIGAGHTVTAIYEIVPAGVDAPDTGEVDKLRYQRKPTEEPEVELVESDDWFTLKLRYKHPEGDKSKLIEKAVKGEAVEVSEADKDFQLAAAVAMFGMKLRNFGELEDFSWDQIAEIARPSLADDPDEQRSEFVKMLKGMQ